MPAKQSPMQSTCTTNYHNTAKRWKQLHNSGNHLRRSKPYMAAPVAWSQTSYPRTMTWTGLTTQRPYQNNRGRARKQPIKTTQNSIRATEQTIELKYTTQVEHFRHNTVTQLQTKAYTLTYQTTTTTTPNTTRWLLTSTSNRSSIHNQLGFCLSVRAWSAKRPTSKWIWELRVGTNKFSSKATEKPRGHCK